MLLTLFLIFSIAWSLLSIGVIVILLRSIINGAIYLPTSNRNVETMMALVKPRQGERAADLGSGDGRILIALAKAGAEAHGYEINPLLVWRSRVAIRRAGLNQKAFVHWRSFWKEDFSSFDLVAVYGITYIMKKLGEKLERELPSGARVISNIFHFPGWSPERVENEHRVLLYIRK